MKQMKCISLLFCGILFSTEILGIGHINKIRPLYDRQKSDIIKKLIKKLNDPKKIPLPERLSFEGSPVYQDPL